MPLSLRRALGTGALVLAALAVNSAWAAEPPGNALETGRIIDPVVCGAASDYSYALYLPSNYTPEQVWPVLLVFDARGRGKMAAGLFRDPAEELGYIVVGSNDVESDGPYEPNLRAVRALLGDLQARLAIDDSRLYAAGFSGGARFACDLGFFMEGRIAGVIGAGAGFSPQKPPTRGTPFAFFGAIGATDFNYYEIRELEDTLQRLDVVHRVESFDGGHGWPPPEVASRGLEWMHLLAMKEGRIPRSDPFIDAQFERSSGEARKLKDSGESIDAIRAARTLVADFEGLRDVDEAIASLARLEESKTLQERRRMERKQIRKDLGYISTLHDLLGSLGTPEGRGFTSERLAVKLSIDDLREQLGPDHPAQTRQRATRLLENVYVQSSFYVPRRLIEERDYRAAATSLSLAVRVKPGEPAAHYNLACALARAGDLGSALESLARAADLGFSDVRLFETDPDLDKLRDRPAFGELLERVRRRQAGNDSSP